MSRNRLAERKGNYPEFKEGFPEFKSGSQFAEFGNMNIMGGLGGGGGIPKTGLLQWLFKDNQPAFSGNEVVDYSGNNNNGLLVKSNCLQPVTDITITLSTPRIGATITELNTSTTELTGVAINGSGHIAITQASLVNPKIWQLKLSTGEEFVFSIGAFNKVYSVSAISNTGTFSGVVTTNWAWSTQDEYHYNIKNGCNGWTDVSGTTDKPINEFIFSTIHDCTLELDVFVTSTGVILRGTGIYLFVFSSDFRLSIRDASDANVNFNFTNLGTSALNWVNNFKHVKLQFESSIGLYGAITCSVSNIDGSNLVTQTINCASAIVKRGQFSFVGGFSPYYPADGSMVKNIKYTTLNTVFSNFIDYNIFYPIKLGQSVDVLGMVCDNNKFLAETKIKLNPNNVVALTNAGYSSTFERRYNSTNQFLGKEFVAGNKNYLIYSQEKDYSDIIKIHSLLGLDHFYKSEYMDITKYLVGNSGRSYTFLITGNSYNIMQFIPLQYTRIIGGNRPTLIGYQAPNTSKTLILNNSTLHLSGVNCRFDNFIVTGQNVRYGVHSDDGGSGAVIQILNDVKVSHLGNDEAIAYYNDLDGTGAQVQNACYGYGGGLGIGGAMFKFNNSEFIGYNRAGIYLHSKATASTTPNNVVIKNTISKALTGTNACFLDNISNSGDRIDFDNFIYQNGAFAINGNYENHFTDVDGVVNGYLIME